MANPVAILDEIFKEAVSLVSGNGGKISSNLSPSEIETLDVLLNRAESSKGVLTVFLTSALYKLIHPEQDIRIHQQNLPGGYSGRSFDSSFVTPFLKEKHFPAMAESGWLTRSLEQNSAYTLDYRGKITPIDLKVSFLSLLDRIEAGVDCKEYLSYILQGLIIQRDSHRIQLAKPTNIPIAKIIELLSRHFSGKYTSSGAARLPVIAIYSVYEILTVELSRFHDKRLMPLESHTSADLRSGRIGDIEVRGSDDRVFEGVEVKHGIEIDLVMLQDAFAKFMTTPVSRFYILSTAGIKSAETQQIYDEIEKIKDVHGCQVVVNGIINTLNYYLRLLEDPAVFLARYATNVENDGALKFEHKAKWNDIVSSK